MNAILPSSTGLSLSPLRSVGLVRIAICPTGTWGGGPVPSIAELSKLRGVRVLETCNLETDFVLSGIAKLFSGELTTLDIKPTAMAVGASTNPVQSTDTGLNSELLRKAFTSSGASVVRAGAKTSFRITLHENEGVGQIGCLGLFNSAGAAGSLATGSLVIGGTPAIGNSITLSVGGRALPPYWVSSTSTATIATSLAAWLNGDGTFTSLYTASASGSTVTITSRGYGTAYNQSLVAGVTGTVTCTATSVTGGVTPGGQLLAAANCNFVKEPGSQVLIEWSITITN